VARASVVSLSESAYQSIRAAIVDLTFPPGSFFLDRDVADLVGASRTPIREALTRLEVEGWVESVPRKGFRVSPVDFDEIAEMSEMIAGMEASGCVVLAREQDRVRTSLLREANAQLSQLADEGDVVGFLFADDRFHRLTVAGGLRRRLTGSIYSLLIDQLHRARRLRPASKEDLARHVEEHRLLIMALELGDAEAAALLCRGHRRRLVERLRTSLESPSRELGSSGLAVELAEEDRVAPAIAPAEGEVSDAPSSEEEAEQVLGGPVGDPAPRRVQRLRVPLPRRNRSEGSQRR